MALAKGTLADPQGDPSDLHLDDPVEALLSPEPVMRRSAARRLSAIQGSEAALLARLAEETDPGVREALLLSIMEIGSEPAARGLAELIRCEDAALRNAAIETLASMPREAAPLMDRLLADDDPDVRTLACNLLQMMAHPSAAEWLTLVVGRDQHPNVCAAAVDGLAEVGSPACIPALDSLARRFPDDPFLQFAIDAVRSRLRTP